MKQVTVTDKQWDALQLAGQWLGCSPEDVLAKVLEQRSSGQTSGQTAGQTAGQKVQTGLRGSGQPTGKQPTGKQPTGKRPVGRPRKGEQGELPGVVAVCGPSAVVGGRKKAKKRTRRHRDAVQLGADRSAMLELIRKSGGQCSTSKLVRRLGSDRTQIRHDGQWLLDRGVVTCIREGKEMVWRSV